MAAEHIRIADLRIGLASRPPLAIDIETSRQAAVAIVLAERQDDTHALLIQRAEREGDPWSGHMAFPGGHREAGDSDLHLTATRETFEEVGIDLTRQAEPIGRLDDIHAQSGRPVDMLIRPYVYAATTDLVPRPNAREVRDTIWLPLSALSRPETAGVYRYPASSLGTDFPAFVYQGFTIWGLTYRMLTVLLGRLG